MSSNSTSAATCAEPRAGATTAVFPVSDYDLAATLGCGQAFRWDRCGDCWHGVVGAAGVELRQVGGTIVARTAAARENWDWLESYLQLGVDLPEIIATFPDDEPMRQALAECRGLRLLRQPVWECLASFLLSSTKQIVHIRQIIGQLCLRHGEPVAGLESRMAVHAFPTAARIAALNEAALRECRMGFRAPYLLAAARAVASGGLDLAQLPRLELAEARARLMELAGVGPKIADCVLLFGCGFPTAFPVDVWVMRALRQSYFRNRSVSLSRLREFSARHFGPHGGYAQQYLFHALRRRKGKPLAG